MRQKIKRLMFKVNRNSIKCVIATLALTVLYNEHVAYIQQTFNWPYLGCLSADVNCVKLLLVADPQIIGEQYDSRSLSSIARWDSDRFTRKTFELAVSHLQPHVVVFLGDLMDEGSIAEADEHARYLARLLSIFSNKSKIQYIWIAGDNDIGGEDDRVSLQKIKRFKTTFRQPDIITVKNTDFIKINRIIHEVPKDRYGVTTLNKTNVLLSHMPLVFLPGVFMKTILLKFHPRVIFAAHEHKSFHVVINRNTFEDRSIKTMGVTEKQVLHLNLGGQLVHELIVPTCSYRMGVPDMGYGAAVIDGAGLHLDYTVFWLPSRFKLLEYYIYISTVVFVYILFCILNAIYLKLRRKKGIYGVNEKFKV